MLKATKRDYNQPVTGGSELMKAFYRQETSNLDKTVRLLERWQAGEKMNPIIPEESEKECRGLITTVERLIKATYGHKGIDPADLEMLANLQARAWDVKKQAYRVWREQQDHLQEEKRQAGY